MKLWIEDEKRQNCEKKTKYDLVFSTKCMLLTFF